jgi:hypothetical protein
LVAVYVVEVLSFAAVDDQRVASYGAKGAHRTVYSTDEEFFGALKDFAGAAADISYLGLRCGHERSKGLKPPITSKPILKL